MFSCGGDVTPNIVMATRWMEKVIKGGSNKVACAVAKIFRDGKFGVSQDCEKALEISVLALKIKSPLCRMIAEMYDKGLGVTEDKEKSANLYQEATRINDEWINDINNLQLRA